MPREILVDAKDLACPGPFIEFLKAFKKAKPGDRIVVLSSDPNTEKDIKMWTERAKQKLLSVTVNNGVWTIVVEKV